ncbi:MAG: FimV family protein [Thiobacillus sp.]
MRPTYALFLLGLCHAGSAAGLGLGELTVRSTLGQPLHATIRILDPDPHGVDCFRLLPADGAVAAPVHPRLTLEPAGSDALLHLRTRQPIVDPILQFTLAFDCGAALRRDYALLLDPPGLAEAAVVADASPATPPTPAAAPATAQERVRPRRAPRLATPAILPRLASPHAVAPASPASPRLVLSGRRMAGQRDAAFALKLDTSLPDLDRPPPPLNETELSDENTALTRKLAHLEAQLVELQQRNAELEARRAAPPAAPPPAAPATPIWPWALLGLGLLTGGVALAAGLRRRRQPQTADYSLVDDWTVPAAIPEVPAAVQSEPAAPPVTARMAEIPQPVREEATEVRDDILDQAEVYMAHGHSELAVHLLQEHLRASPTESPVPWLLLLELLQRDGDLAGYAAAAAECRKHFNIALADLPDANQPDTSAGLEAYPHLLDRLAEVWRTPEVDAFFDGLILDHRGGTRMGFSPAAYREILLLRAIAQDIRAAA